MHNPATIRWHLTFDAFLALEDQSTVKHEYVSGTLHAMAGASQPHNHIASNILSALGVAAEGTNCIVYGSAMLVRAAEDAAYCPDVSVDCEPIKREQRFLDQRVVRSFRDAAGAWWDEDIAGESAFRLTCPATTLSPQRIYWGVEFP